LEDEAEEPLPRHEEVEQKQEWSRNIISRTRSGNVLMLRSLSALQFCYLLVLYKTKEEESFVHE
jgi:hypothetical protein